MIEREIQNKNEKIKTIQYLEIGIHMMNHINGDS